MRLRLLALALVLGGVGMVDLADPGQPKSGGVVLSAPLTTSGHLSACTAADSCVLDCGVGIATGSDKWECVDPYGYSWPITQGTGTLYEDTVFTPDLGGKPRRAARMPTDAAAPSLDVTPPLGAGFLDQPHTIVSIGNHQSASVAPMMLGLGGSFYLRDLASPAMVANYGASGGVTQCGISGNVQNKYGVVTVRRNSSNACYLRLNGVNGSPGTINGTMDISGPSYFGNWSAGASWIGNLARVRFYSRELSDTEIARVESQWFGAIAGERNVSVARASTAWVEDGETDNRNLINRSETFDLWEADGSSTAIANTAADPDGNMTADRVTVGAFSQGYRYQFDGFKGTGDKLTFSVWFRAEGGSESVSVRILDATAGSSVICNSSDVSVSSTWQQVSCSTSANTVAGNQLRPIFYISGQGRSVLAAKAQINPGTTIKPYCATGTTPKQCAGPRINMIPRSEEIDSATWIKSSGASTVITPNVAIAPDGNQTADLMTYTAADHACLYQWQTANVSVGNTYTFSVWAKPVSGTTTNGRMQINGSGLLETANSVAFAEGWNQYTLTGTATGNSTVAVYVCPNYEYAQTGSVLFWGAQFNEGGPAPYCKTTSTPGQCGGQFHAVGDNSLRIKPGVGALIEEGTTNNWINSLDASSWGTFVGDTTVLTNVESGPFAAYNGGPEVDLITTTAGNKGKVQTAANTAAGAWTMSCFVKAGTMDTVQLWIYSDTDGATSGPATKISSSGFQRVTYTRTVTGTPTGVNGYLIVGGGADSGSIYVSQCQFENKHYATSPIVCGASACQRLQDVVTVPNVPVPASKGDVSLDFTPLWSTQDPAPLLPNYNVLNTQDDTGQNHWWIYGSRAGPGAYFRATNGFGESTGTGNFTFTAGTTYRYHFQWSGSTAKSLLPVPAVNVSFPRLTSRTPTTVYIGSNKAGGDNATGFIGNVRISQ